MLRVEQAIELGGTSNLARNRAKEDEPRQS